MDSLPAFVGRQVQMYPKKRKKRIRNISYFRGTTRKSDIQQRKGQEMNFYTSLKAEHSKALTTKIVKEIIAEPKRMKEIVDLILDAPYRITQRAAWSLSVVAEKHSELLLPFLPTLVKKLEEKGNHPSINRNIVRALQYIEVPKKLEGKVLDNCFKLLNSQDEPLAVRCFSMTVIHNLVGKYPEIKRELAESINSQIDQQSAGFKSRGRRILKELESIM